MKAPCFFNALDGLYRGKRSLMISTTVVQLSTPLPTDTARPLSTLIDRATT